jgi:DNA polymerase-3 subunit gamma/tau
MTMQMTLREKYRPTTLDEVLGNQTTKKMLANIVRRETPPNFIILHGPKGAGKSSLARILIRALRCHRRTESRIVPCGACDSCTSVRLDPLNHVITHNCAELRLEDVARDFKWADYSSGAPLVVFYEEFHRANERLQDLLTTEVENEYRDFHLILATTMPWKLDGALVQRAVSLPVSGSSKEEIVQRLRYICDCEQIAVDDPKVLDALAERLGGAPRDAIGRLEELTLIAGDEPLSLDHLAELGGNTFVAPRDAPLADVVLDPARL